MNTVTLKNLQAPLKEKYHQQPESAIITLKAEGKIGEDLSCNVETGRAMVKAGLHPATGGTGMLACSGDMLLQALVACVGVTLQAVTTAIGVEIKGGTVTAEGDLDFKGTLGVSKEVPIGFKNIRLRFDPDSNAWEEQMAAVKTYRKILRGAPNTHQRSFNRNSL
jgi:uncharacterized OsmC-like protein